VALVMIKIGSASQKTNDYTKALEYFKKSLKIIKRLKE
jgi:hypothetical protein